MPRLPKAFIRADQSRRTVTSKEHGDVLSAISDGMLALLKECDGLSPTQAKTYTPLGINGLKAYARS